MGGGGGGTGTLSYLVDFMTNKIKQEKKDVFVTVVYL